MYIRSCHIGLIDRLIELDKFAIRDILLGVKLRGRAATGAGSDYCQPI